VVLRLPVTPARSLVRSAAVVTGCLVPHPSTAAVMGRDGLAMAALVTSWS